MSARQRSAVRGRGCEAAEAAAVRHRYPTQRVVESTERLLPGGARNVGIANTDGTFVAFLAADCIAEPGWI